MSADPPPTSTSSAWEAESAGCPARHVPHREIDQPALLRHVDDVHLEPGPDLHPVEERVGVRRLAHRAGRDGAVAGRAVLVHQVLEALEGAQGRFHRAGADASRRERVFAERHAAHHLLDDERPAARGELGHDEAHGACADVDDRDGFRGRAAAPPGRWGLVSTTASSYRLGTMAADGNRRRRATPPTHRDLDQRCNSINCYI